MVQLRLGRKADAPIPADSRAGEGHRAILIEEIADDAAIRIRRDPL